MTSDAGGPVDPIQASGRSLSFDLPWPWDGERFELSNLPAITYITGPLGSGKTRLAMAIAETLPGAIFLGLDRSRQPDGGASRGALPESPIDVRVAATMARLVDDGAIVSSALRTLLTAIESETARPLVVDMVEEGLDEATQKALVADLRRRGHGTRLLVLMTRSTAILDVCSVGDDEAILYCPANHSPPFAVSNEAGAPGYEALVTCLASPAVRARTAGLRALQPNAS